MSEQLGVDSAFRDCSAVYGDVLAVLARAVGMDNLREKLLSGAAFAVDKHRQVDRRHLQSASHSRHQGWGVSDDSKSLFGFFYFGGYFDIHIAVSIH